MVNRNGKGPENKGPRTGKGRGNCPQTTSVESPSKTLNSNDWKKIGKGALFAIGTSVLTYSLTVLPTLNLGLYTAGIVSVLTVAINAGLKYFTGKKQ